MTGRPTESSVFTQIDQINQSIISAFIHEHSIWQSEFKWSLDCETDGAYGLSSLSEKTRKSNHLQMVITKARLSPKY